MKNEILALALVALLLPTFIPPAQATPVSAEDSCAASSVVDIIDAVGGTKVTFHSTQLVPGVSNGDGSSVDYDICQQVDGICNVVELSKKTKVSAGGWHVIFFGRATVDTTVKVKTELHCTGFYNVRVLNFGGAALRAVSSLLGSIDLPKEGGSQILSHQSARDTDSCEYIGQVDRCRTHHSGEWELYEIYDGRLMMGGGFSVCSPLDIYNNANYPTFGLLPGGHHWTYHVCHVIRAREVPDQDML